MQPRPTHPRQTPHLTFFSSPSRTAALKGPARSETDSGGTGEPDGSQPYQVRHKCIRSTRKVPIEWARSARQPGPPVTPPTHQDLTEGPTSQVVEGGGPGVPVGLVDRTTTERLISCASPYIYVQYMMQPRPTHPRQTPHLTFFSSPSRTAALKGPARSRTRYVKPPYRFFSLHCSLVSLTGICLHLSY